MPKGRERVAVIKGLTRVIEGRREKTGRRGTDWLLSVRLPSDPIFELGVVEWPLLYRCDFVSCRSLEIRHLDACVRSESRRRPITRKLSTSSVPSKIDSTLASANNLLTVYSSA